MLSDFASFVVWRERTAARLALQCYNSMQLLAMLTPGSERYRRVSDQATGAAARWNVLREREHASREEAERDMEQAEQFALHSSKSGRHLEN
jgi:hypothetical protein